MSNLYFQSSALCFVPSLPCNFQSPQATFTTSLKFVATPCVDFPSRFVASRFLRTTSSSRLLIHMQDTSSSSSSKGFQPAIQSDTVYLTKLAALVVPALVLPPLLHLSVPLAVYSPLTPLGWWLLSYVTLFPRRIPDFATLQSRGPMNSELRVPPNAPFSTPCVPPPTANTKIYSCSKDNLAQCFFQVVAQQPRATMLASQPDRYLYSLVDRTLICQFPDIVTVQFYDVPSNPATSTLAIYSQSIYGQGDVGVNKKRVDAWLQQLDNILAAKS